MRLLLRANAHQETDDGLGVQIAASPDTPRREQWQWHLRVVSEGSAVGAVPQHARLVSAELPRSDGQAWRVELSADPAAAAPGIDVVRVGGKRWIERGIHEVVVVLAGHGTALVEGRHLLGEMDALILEGDDPLGFSVEPGDGMPVSVAVARLHGTGALGWVP